MKLELNDKEVALLMGIINSTTGDAFQPMFAEMLDYAEKNNPDIIKVAMLMSDKFRKQMKYHPNEDDIYEEAIMDWNKGEGLMPSENK